MAITLSVFGQDFRRDYAPKEVVGSATNGLSCGLIVVPTSCGWDIDIQLAAETNYPARVWLRITNQVGSQLELQRTNGSAVASTNVDALAAFHLPLRTTVSEIMQHSSIPRDRRAYQWWLVGHAARVGDYYETALFKLESVFPICLTNDYVLRVTPLIYKAETNDNSVNLIKFPPVKIRIYSNGDVRKE